MKTLVCAAVAALTLAATAAAITGPTPVTASAYLTPVVRAEAAQAHSSWTFARAVCVREATPDRFLCTSAHVRNGVLVDRLSDVWEVVATGSRWRYAPATVCPIGLGRCVNTSFAGLGSAG